MLVKCEIFGKWVVFGKILDFYRFFSETLGNFHQNIQKIIIFPSFFHCKIQFFLVQIIRSNLVEIFVGKSAHFIGNVMWEILGSFLMEKIACEMAGKWEFFGGK